MATKSKTVAPLPHSRLITGKAAAAYMGICPKTFWDWVNKGVIPQVSIPGANPKYDIHDLDRLIERHKRYIESSYEIVDDLVSDMLKTNQNGKA